MSADLWLVRILVVSSADIFPPDRGDKRRVHAIVKQLSRRHEVLLAAPRTQHPEGVDVEAEVFPLTAHGGLRQLLDPLLVQRLRSLIGSFKPDVIQLEVAWLAPQLVLAAHRRALPFYYDTQGVERDRAFTTRRWSWPYPVAAETLAIRIADAVLVVSEGDRSRMIELGVAASKLQVVPNGYDEEEFAPSLQLRAQQRGKLGVPDDRLLVLFFGELTYAPNKAGMTILRTEIVPRLERSGVEYQLVLAGSGSEKAAPDLGARRVAALGWVPSMSEVINAADVVVAPLGRGGGSRLKIIESIACGTPVVANTWAAEGIRRDLCGQYLTVTDDWDAFAAAVLRCTPGSLPRRTPEAFAGYYEWKQIVSSIRYPEPAG